MTCHELTADNRRANDFRSIDDLLDARYTEGHVHCSNASEMEGFQRHLRTWLTNRLSANSANSRTWMNTVDKDQGRLGW